MEIGKKLIEPLITCPEASYGERFHDHLMEQYKLYVESAQHVSDRRESANNYLLTINSTLVTLYGVASAALGSQHWHLVVPIVGFLVCITWHALVTSYRDLNTAKFKIIHEIEQHLPAALFRSEWQLCEYGVGKRYKPLTHIERHIPELFAVLYIGLAAYTLWGAS